MLYLFKLGDFEISYILYLYFNRYVISIKIDIT